MEQRVGRAAAEAVRSVNGCLQGQPAGGAAASRRQSRAPLRCLKPRNPRRSRQRRSRKGASMPGPCIRLEQAHQRGWICCTTTGVPGVEPCYKASLPARDPWRSAPSCPPTPASHTRAAAGRQGRPSVVGRQAAGLGVPSRTAKWQACWQQLSNTGATTGSGRLAACWVRWCGQAAQGRGRLLPGARWQRAFVCPGREVSTHVKVARPSVYQADAAGARCCGQPWVGAQGGHLGNGRERGGLGCWLHEVRTRASTGVRGRHALWHAPGAAALAQSCSANNPLQMPRT